MAPNRSPIMYTNRSFPLAPIPPNTVPMIDKSSMELCELFRLVLKQKEVFLRQLTVSAKMESMLQVQERCFLQLSAPSLRSLATGFGDEQEWLHLLPFVINVTQSQIPGILEGFPELLNYLFSSFFRHVTSSFT